MRIYAGGGLAFFDSGLLPGETEGGMLWMEKQKEFNDRKELKQMCTDFAGGGAVKFAVP
jgi:hypothetical protein